MINNRKNLVEPLLHILVLVILFGFPYTFAGSQEDIDWKMLVNRGIAPLAMCVVFYADYFLLVPKLLFRGRRALWFNVNVWLVLAAGFYASEIVKIGESDSRVDAKHTRHIGFVAGQSAFEGGTRSEAVGFSIGNRGYVLTGKSSTAQYDDMWEFFPQDEYEEND